MACVWFLGLLTLVALHSHHADHHASEEESSHVASVQALRREGFTQPRTSQSPQALPQAPPPALPQAAVVDGAPREVGTSVEHASGAARGGGGSVGGGSDDGGSGGGVDGRALAAIRRITSMYGACYPRQLCALPLDRIPAPSFSSEDVAAATAPVPWIWTRGVELGAVDRAISTALHDTDEKPELDLGIVLGQQRRRYTSFVWAAADVVSACNAAVGTDLDAQIGHFVSTLGAGGRNGGGAGAAAGPMVFTIIDGSYLDMMDDMYVECRVTVEWHIPLMKHPNADARARTRCSVTSLALHDATGGRCSRGCRWWTASFMCRWTVPRARRPAQQATLLSTYRLSATAPRAACTRPSTAWRCR